MSKVLLLDVMSTLVYDPFYVEMPSFFGMTLDELIRQKHPTAWLEYEKGHWSEQRFLDSFFADGRSYDQRGMVDHMHAAYSWLEGTENLLRELRNAAIPMHLVSNYSDWYHAIEAKLGLSRYAPWTFVSCDWGLRKPDAEVYRQLLTHLAIEPGDALFIDDSAANCDAARACGLEASRFTDTASLRDVLVALGILS